jgi:hypothetical protein
MKIKKLNQKGFGAVEVLLLVVVIGLIAGAGYYVWNAKKNTESTLNNTANSQGEPSKSTSKVTSTKVAAEEDSWLLYTAPSKKYSIRIPDGWSAGSIGDNLHSNSIDYKKGTQGKVGVITHSVDGYSLFSLNVPASASTKQGTEQGSFSTASGLKVHKYYKVATESDGPGINAGDKIYTYYFDQDGKNIEITYVITNVIENGTTDRTSDVERAIKTIKVN